MFKFIYNAIIDMLYNQVLVGTFFGWLVGQGSKMIVEAAKGKFSAKRLSGGGGMPSAHSATMAALVISTGYVYGLRGFEFAIALFFACIVCYDAMGVRYETGQQAKALNKLNQSLSNEDVEPLYDPGKPMEESMGHTPGQVAVGLLVGMIVAIIVNAVYRAVLG